MKGGREPAGSEAGKVSRGRLGKSLVLYTRGLRLHAVIGMEALKKSKQI